MTVKLDLLLDTTLHRLKYEEMLHIVPVRADLGRGVVELWTAVLLRVILATVLFCEMYIYIP